jgi:hypothetical protein
VRWPGILSIVGAGVAGAGAWLAFHVGSTVGACQAFGDNTSSDCAGANDALHIGSVIFWLGVIALVVALVGAITRSRRRKRIMPAPGWYQDPDAQWRWWDPDQGWGPLRTPDAPPPPGFRA